MKYKNLLCPWEKNYENKFSTGLLQVSFSRKNNNVIEESQRVRWDIVGDSL